MNCGLDLFRENMIGEGVPPTEITIALKCFSVIDYPLEEIILTKDYFLNILFIRVLLKEIRHAKIF